VCQLGHLAKMEATAYAVFAEGVSICAVAGRVWCFVDGGLYKFRSPLPCFSYTVRCWKEGQRKQKALCLGDHLQRRC